MSQPPPPGEPVEETDFADDPVDLSDINVTDGLVLVVFWLLAFVVFLQFFTRYVLNDSLGWTEEIARFLLIGVTFIGAIMAVRKQSHIAVEIVYRWLPRPARRVLQAVVDLVCVAFYAGLTFLTVELAGRTQQMMVSIDVPKAAVYWIVAACFAAMTLLSLWGTVRHVMSGTSRLIDPDRGLEAAPGLE